MQELEKILEEIDIKITQSMWRKREGLFEAENIIRKHMNDNNLCGECSRRKWYQIGYKDGKDGGWISVDERLPEEKGVYLVTYHPCYWDNVEAEVRVGIDTFRGKMAWAQRKYQRVIAWRPLPEPYHPERSEE